MDKRRAVTEALWKTITLVYADPDDPRALHVQIPVKEATEALLTCVANVIASCPDAGERNEIVRMASPAIGKAVGAARGTSGLLLPEDGLILPH